MSIFFLFYRTDEGGYSPFNSESPKKLEFINSLRGYQPKKPCPSNDFFSKSQFILPIAEILKANKKVKTQKIATERLTNISKSTVVRLPRII